MNRSLPVVQIGPFSEDPAESVSVVNRTFVQGLESSYAFVPYCDSRKYGTTRQSRLNPINAAYFLKNLSLWLARLAIYRPQVVHYAISSGWALEKGLVFLRIARFFGARTLGHLHSGGFIDFWNGLPRWRKKRALRELNRLD